ncbi:MAG: dihydrolipoyl dehydrogenase [Holosporales bacterium]|jgi:dihydrolipoamide dehydrogenase|nr:dihydrolipoyl dehydrogenase [Holosporales bacterium]
MKNIMDIYDLIVIGGGPGGYVAAIRAAQLGKKVALVEEKHLGGVCLNWGCVPTKALLRSAELKHMADHAESFGFNRMQATFDIKKIVARSRAVADKLAHGVKNLLRKNKVVVLDGRGVLKSPTSVEVTDKSGNKSLCEAKRLILATGARPRIIPGLEPDGKFVWTSREAMAPEEFPQKILVIGSGAIGVEFASFYHLMGSQVTIVEMQDRILLTEDDEIAKMAHKSLEKQGIKIFTKATANITSKNAKNVKVLIKCADTSQENVFDRIIVAAGVVANLDGIGIENTKIKVENGRVAVNEFNLTDEPGIYAIGDIVSAPWLAHKASREGVIAAEHAFDALHVRPLNRSAVPGCIYSIPQIASVGLTEKAAKEQYGEVNVGRFPYLGNGKAIAMGEEEGLIKTVFDKKTGELLGAHLIGSEVTELIQGFVMAKASEATDAEFIEAIFPHPTLSEMMHESVLDSYGQAIHI